MWTYIDNAQPQQLELGIRILNTKFGTIQSKNWDEIIRIPKRKAAELL